MSKSNGVTHKGVLVKYSGGKEVTQEPVLLHEHAATYRITGTKMFFKKDTGHRCPYSPWYNYRLQNVTSITQENV